MSGQPVDTLAEAKPVRGSRAPRRWPVLVLLAALVASGVAAEQRVETPAVLVEAAEVAAPTAAPAGALSSTWFCAAATAEKNGRAEGMLWIANPTDEAVRVRTTFIPVAGAGPEKTIEFSVAASSRRFLRHSDYVTAPFAAALVEVDGGEVAVEHSVQGPLGEDHAPCASAASPEWHFANGSTARDATMLLALFNPFPDDAIAELSFTHEEGRSAPGDLQGLVVPARGLVVVDVGTQVRRREQVAATVTTRSGRLVVDRIQLRSERPRRGMTLNLGAPAAGEVWYFPEGVKSDNVAERVAVYNPGGEEAVVDVELTLDEGAVEPFELRIPPRDRTMVDIGAEARVPKGVAHSLTVRSVNGERIVAERWIEANGGGRLGLAASLGSPAGARRWLFPAGASNGAVDEWIILQNPGSSDATIDITALASGRLLPIEGLQNLGVPAGGRRAVRLGDHIRRDDLAVLVSASQPVVAERGIYRVGTTGISTAVGITLR